MFPNFHHHPRLGLPKLKQNNLATGRVYSVVGTDLVYPSITRVLGAKPKPELEAWRKRVGKKEAAQVSKKASWRGTKLHTLAEEYLGNLPMVDEIPPYVMELWQHLHPWLDANITGVYEQEVDLYSDKLLVAGRTDLIAEVNGVVSVVDFKQSNKPKKEAYIEDYCIQGAFYALALYERTGIKCTQVVLPIASPEGLRVFTIRPKDYYNQLREAIDYFYTHATPSVI